MCSLGESHVCSFALILSHFETKIGEAYRKDKRKVGKNVYTFQ